VFGVTAGISIVACLPYPSIDRFTDVLAIPDLELVFLCCSHLLADGFQLENHLLATETPNQLGVSLANTVVFILQLHTLLAFVRYFRESQPNLHGSVGCIL
jgi:hypothetical protein